MATPYTVRTDSAGRILPVVFNWRTLLQLSAVADLVVMAGMGVVLGDRLPLGLAMLIAVGLWLLHLRGGVPGIILLALVFGDTTLWTVGAVLSDIVQGEELVRLVIPLSLAAISGAGLISAAATLVWRKHSEAGSRAARLVGLGAVAFFALGLLASLFVGHAQSQAIRPDDLVVKAENMSFSTTTLTADHGQVTIDVDNHDVWWHTFTIDGLGVNLQIPSSGKRQVTFNAAPGTYTFYCAIPGHASFGMRGTLTVR